MTRTLLATLGLLAATAPLHAHEAGGLAHLHPHGTEAALAALALFVAGVFVWRSVTRNR
ncbi:MAG: hypothetical protein N4A39_17750 [Roseicyclus sp.]|jgi:hypothetical protein|nr:hypothetical protein [Roseicyclus sp.]